MLQFTRAFAFLLITFLLVGCKPGVAVDLTMETPTPPPSPVVEEGATAPAPQAAAVADDTAAQDQPTPSTPPAAQTPSSYIPFSKAAFDQARAAGRPIVLFFYATWCPTCRVQEPIYQSVYASGELAELGVQAFRVNFNDSDTDADEKALAGTYGITYQHTFVLLNADGKEAGRTFGHRSAAQVKADAQKTQ